MSNKISRQLIGKKSKIKLSSEFATTTNPKEEGQGNDAKQLQQ